MGDSLKDYMMRGIFVICALAVIAGAFATTHEDSYSQATALIQDMKKKGATEADCKDLAKTTCKEVLSEVKKDQTVIDSQSSGIECNKLGVRAVEVAVKHYHKRVRQWTISKKTITKWATHKVNLGVKTFISLKPGKCGFIFASRSYRSIYAKYHRAVKYERTVRGWVIEAKKAVVITKRSQKNQQETRSPSQGSGEVQDDAVCARRHSCEQQKVQRLPPGSQGEEEQGCCQGKGFQAQEGTSS